MMSSIRLILPVRWVGLACIGLLLAAAPAMAKASPQGASASGAPKASDQNPIDISAEESLEWYQDQRLYVARGKARAVHGDTVIEANILTARQRDGATPKSKGGNEGMGDIDRLTAEGDVKIVDPRQQVYGEKAVYDVDRKAAKMTGSNLKYVTAKDVVTARDSLEYYEDRNIAVARGHAVAEHQESRIEADVLTAHFARDAAGQMDMSEITAVGHVVILTKDGGISRGDRGVYDAKKDVAILMDNVRITRGETQLAGDKAEVNFATGQSRLLNSGSGRVRALLPASGNKKEKTSP